MQNLTWPPLSWAQRGCALLLSALFSHTVSADTLNVITSIRPVDAIVTAVGGDAVRTHILMDGLMSPHSMTLRPSHLSRLSDADLLVWVGPEIETFLPKALRASGTANLKWSDSASGSSESSKADKHAQEDHTDRGKQSGHGHEHAHGDDPHLWMAPETVVAFAHRIADALAERAPAQADAFHQRADAFAANIETMDKALIALFADEAPSPVAVLHDAFEHFVSHYGLPDPLALTSLAGELPSVRDVRRATRTMADTGTRCLFVEPGANPRWHAMLTSQQPGLQVATVDPLGRRLESGPDWYPRFFESLANAFTACER